MDMPTTTTLESGGKPLTGRVAVITGSTSGIGLGIAKALADAGADIVLNGIADAATVGHLVAEMEASGARAAFDGANLLDPSAAADLVPAAIERFGRVDVLVNNAGIQHVAPVDEFPPAKWDAIIGLNLSAAFHTIRTALPAMREQRFGRIINVASAHALVASPYKSAYVAAKHGVLGLTRTVALEAARFGVTCNAICPGYVWTDLVERQIEDTATARGISHEQVINDVLLAAQPSKRFATVEEIGALAAFLTSDAAASITGTALSVDGGWTAQ